MKMLLVLMVLLVAAPCFAQADIPGRVGKFVGKAVDEHNKAVNEAINGPLKNTPAAANAGWIQRPLAGGGNVRLYFAHPAIAHKNPHLPALLVIQEWWGLNDDIQERTRELASKGFYALAVDLYDGKVAKEPKDAAALKAKLTDEAALVRLRAGVDLLTEEARNGVVDAKRIASIGWCMGGACAVKLGIADPRIKGVVIFYGTPVTDVEQVKRIQGPVLGIFGREDKSIPVPTVEKFARALTEAKIPHEIKIYDGVGHAFASKPAAAMKMYNEEKAKEAWAVTWEWLEKFKNPKR